MIKGITFDLWDTVFIDDSDEPKRKADGRPTKAVERRQLVHQFVAKPIPLLPNPVSRLAARAGTANCALGDETPSPRISRTGENVPPRDGNLAWRVKMSGENFVNRHV